MKKLFDKKVNLGITLIALVITIVVLIILATVVINLSLGENGIFNRAREAKEQYNNAQEYEETEIAKASNEIDSFIDGNRQIADPEEFTITSQYNIVGQNCFYIPSTKQVHIYAWINGLNNIVINDMNLNASIVAVVPEKYRPKNDKSDLANYFNSSSTTQIGAVLVKNNGSVFCPSTGNKLSNVIFSIDYVITDN